VKDQESLVAELTGIERALGSRSPLDFYPRLAVGQRCRIIAGPLMGLEGVVVDRDRLCKVVLQIGILGQGAMLEVNADLLEVMD